MATHLTIAALNHLHKNTDLQKEVLPYLGVGEAGLKSAIMRSSNSLTTWYVVEKIAKSMGAAPVDILEVEKNEDNA